MELVVTIIAVCTGAALWRVIELTDRLTRLEEKCDVLRAALARKDGRKERLEGDEWKDGIEVE